MADKPKTATDDVEALDAEPISEPEPIARGYVVVRPWDHGTLYTCSLCGNYPDFSTREETQIHVDSHFKTA